MSLTSLHPAEIGRRLYRSHTVHTPVPSPAAITAEHMRLYWAQGFLAVENVFNAGEVRDGLAGLKFLIDGGVPGFEGLEFEKTADGQPVPFDERENHVRKLMYFTTVDVRLGALAKHPNLIGLCERLLGSKVRLTQDMALLKPPRGGREKPWHQDNAYFNHTPLDGVIGTWTALDEATIENGCMHVIPGSHLLGPQPHFHDRDCQLPDELIDVEADVVVPLKPGGVLFFHGLLYHGTPPNQSIAKRRAVQFHYASEQCRLMTDDEHMAVFKDDIGYAGCRGWAMGTLPRRVADRRF